MLELLSTACGLSPASVVADVGSGSGIFSRLLLEVAGTVYGIEPNDAMRAAAERLLARDTSFHSLAGTAEDTGLTAASVDLITAAQAFHWFEGDATRAEFRRVLRPRGYVALLWNQRRVDATPFLRAYETLLNEHSIDYAKIRHYNISPERIAAFYSPQSVDTATFANRQRFDFAGFLGRHQSSSYVPLAGHPKYEPMVEALRRLYDEHAVGGQVTFEYDTTVYYGRLH